MEVEIIKIGEGLGIILPAETLTRLKVAEGDKLTVIEKSDGLQIGPCGKEFDFQLQAARGIMTKREAVLRELAK